jgi:hypothetical protein
MNDDRRSILQMLAEGKITADEAERLLSALEQTAPAAPRPLSGASGTNGAARYLRVVVDTDEPADTGPTKVNVRVPISLLRAGVRLASILPPQAREQINREMAKNGVPFDINQIKPENLEDLVDQLNDFQVDVDQEKTKVRVFCE